MAIKFIIFTKGQQIKTNNKWYVYLVLQGLVSVGFCLRQRSFHNFGAIKIQLMLIFLANYW